MGLGVLESVQEEDSSSTSYHLRRPFPFIRERQRCQGKIILEKRNKIRQQGRFIELLEKRQTSHLSTIQSQLLIFESNLKKAKKEFDSVVRTKEETIRQQNQLICALSLALVKRGGHDDLRNILPGIKISTSNLDEVGKKTSRGDRDSLRRLGKKDVQVISSSKDPDSLNDSDSAIMMEDAYDSLIVIPVGKGEAKVMRSVSDALEIVSRSSSLTSIISKAPCEPPSILRRKSSYGSTSTTPSCSSEESDGSPPSTMTKLEVLRAIPDIGEDGDTSDTYSLVSSAASSSIVSSSLSFPPESPSVTPIASPSSFHKSIPCEDSGQSESLQNASFDSDTTLSEGVSDEDDSATLCTIPENGHVGVKSLKGSYEKLNHISLSFYQKKPTDELIQVTYNRVMSNHRSVTKPKDVKYKRINKAKSRSLEELRGKLKFYDNKQQGFRDTGHSEA